MAAPKPHVTAAARRAARSTARRPCSRAAAARRFCREAGGPTPSGRCDAGQTIDAGRADACAAARARGAPGAARTARWPSARTSARATTSSKSSASAAWARSTRPGTPNWAWPSRVKVIRPEALKDPREAQELERRFKRELLLARQVTHKSVVRIHDLGEIQGIKYITMSFVDGEDLSTVLRREGRLPIGRVLAIAREVVSGMQAAHEAGVVHRDLKPANIMIDHEDHALIMDFGIALSSDKNAKDKPAAPGAGRAAARRGRRHRDDDGREPAAVDSSATVLGATPPATSAAVMKASRSGTILSTKSGGIVGTLEYMAPEQSKGEPVDQRTRHLRVRPDSLRPASSACGRCPKGRRRGRS